MKPDFSATGAVFQINQSKSKMAAMMFKQWLTINKESNKALRLYSTIELFLTWSKNSLSLGSSKL